MDDSKSTKREFLGEDPMGEGFEDLPRAVAKSDQNLERRNEQLVQALTASREMIATLRLDVEQLTQPPNGFSHFLNTVGESQIDVVHAGRKLRVYASQDILSQNLEPGQEIVLNEAMAAVYTGGFEQAGEIATVKELLGGGRAIVAGQADDERAVRLAGPVLNQKLRAGDTVIVDSRSGFAVQRIWRSDVETLVLEEIPDVDYDDIGGLELQIEHIRDAVELPFTHPELYRDHGLKPPKGVLLYGPPGCGKTLVAKAVARSLAASVTQNLSDVDEVTRNVTDPAEPRSYFLNIKGPELLNKYVGETERQIRLVFARAREKASEGVPVVVFFDEMDSLFRTRGSGVSSDVETTIVPQLLSEIDGVEALDNVIVIGASNREDMIDPAILRPGRLDVKIKIDRPNARAAQDIFSRYLTSDLPLHPEELEANDGDREHTVRTMISTVISHMYARESANEFLEITYASGATEVLYFKDFASGAMIRNIVDRAKKFAIKNLIATGQRGLKTEHLIQGIRDEFTENEDLPNTTHPDDWARISGRKGDRVIHLRTLSRTIGQAAAEIGEISPSGEYL